METIQAVGSPREIEIGPRNAVELWSNLLADSQGVSTGVAASLREDFAPVVRRAGPADFDTIVSRLEAHPELSFSHRWEAAKLRQALEEGSSPILVATREDTIVGIAVGGVHGVRAVIHHVVVEPEVRGTGVGTQLIDSMLAEFAERGVYRAHVFVGEQSEGALAFLDAYGFAPQIGERFMQRDLISSDDSSLLPPHVPEGVTLRSAVLTDIPDLIRCLEPVKEIAFQPWETALLRAWAEEPQAGQIFKIARNAEGEIIGAIVGGHNGLRGTINHTWVVDRCQARGLGSFMAVEAIREFAEAGVKRLHLMVTPGNDVAFGFWTKHHFAVIPGETFVEIDIPCRT